jgi:hypothetical protein
MTIEKLIQQCEIRLDYLKRLRVSNIELSNQEAVNKLDAEIAETEQTISILKNI